MTTIVTDSPEEAASYVRRGELCAFPTETVYGLGADALDAAAVRHIFEAKGRPADNPLIVHISDLGQIGQIAAHVPAAAARFIDRFFPGPLTLVLPKRDAVPDVVTAGLDTVGVRMPKHPVAQAFLKACGRPVAAPSANRSGRPSPTTWNAVLQDLEGRIPCVLRGGRSQMGLESTVVDCTSQEPVVLRAGAVSIDALRSVVPATKASTMDEAAAARSPGTRHRHYAPHARVVIVAEPPAAPELEAAFIGVDAPESPELYQLVEIAETLEEYAHELFDFMRRCDAEGIRVIYCEEVEPKGLGVALMDRLHRAAEAHARTQS